MKNYIKKNPGKLSNILRVSLKKIKERKWGHLFVTYLLFFIEMVNFNETKETVLYMKI